MQIGVGMTQNRGLSWMWYFGWNKLQLEVQSASITLWNRLQVQGNDSAVQKFDDLRNEGLKKGRKEEKIYMNRGTNEQTNERKKEDLRWEKRER